MMAGAIGLVLLCADISQAELEGVEHGRVFYENGRFAGWPANNGLWSWGDEIVVGFTLGYFDPDKVNGHPIDRNRPFGPMQARSSSCAATAAAGTSATPEPSNGPTASA